MKAAIANLNKQTRRSKNRHVTFRYIDENCSSNPLHSKSVILRRKVARILGKSDQRLRITREFASKHWLVNQIHAKLDRVSTARVHHIVAHLIFLLIAPDWERCNWRRKLIVAECFKAGYKRFT